MYYEKTLENGIRIIGQKMPHLHSVSLGVWAGTGSVKEHDGEAGISHFIEHMLFKGTERRSAKKIAEEMDSIGAQLNAFTSKECTCFYAKTLDEQIDIAADILSDMVLHSVFDPQEMEKEKGVVIEEINMSEDTPEDVAMELLAATYFGDAPHGKPILGTRDSVRSFTRDQILSYMDRHYRENNLLLAVAGNFDENRVEKLAHKYFGSKGSGIPLEPYPVPQIPQGVRFAAVEKDIEQCHIAFALPAFGPMDPNFYPMMVLNNALGGSMSSRLFQVIREQNGLAYSVYSFNSAYKDTGSLGIYAGTGASLAKSVLALITEELDKVKNHGVTEEEFRRSRGQLRGSYILGNESPGARMNAIGKNKLLYGTVRTEEEVIRDIESVTLEKVNELARQVLVTDNMAVAVVGKTNGLKEELEKLTGRSL